MSRVTNTNQIAYGKEPMPPKNQVFMDSKAYNLFLSTSFNWYNNMVKDADKKKWVIDWGIVNGFNANDLKLIPETYLTTMGSMVRLYENGFEFNDNHYQKIFDTLSDLVFRFKNPQSDQPKMKRITVDKVGLVMTVFDNAIDNVMDGKSYETLTIDQPLSAPNVNELKSYYNRQLADLGEDSNLVNVHNEILTLLAGKIKKSAPRKPRVKKPVPAKKQVSKLNYMLKDNNFGLKSINPEKIIGASKLVMFNVNNRKLTVFYADEGGFSVSGSTLRNFTDQSACKTIRKPSDKLPEFLSAPKVRTDKVFKLVKSVKSKVTGRINKHNILLKVFK